MATATTNASSTRRYVVTTLIVAIVVMSEVSHAQYNQFFGASNYFGVGMNSNHNQGYWYAQSQCPWGTAGFRAPSVYQCGTFTCPSMWFGTTSYNCPVGTIYSNTLQMCVTPSVLANTCRRRAG